jgi:hypothetical protein
MQLRQLRLKHTFGLGYSPAELRNRARDCIVPACGLVVFTLSLYVVVLAGTELTIGRASPRSSL